MIVGKCTISADEIISALEKEATLILATCADSRVTIRPMSHINDGLNIFFQTCADSLKMTQIAANPLVALCLGTYEIEGTATAFGHPMEEKNANFAQAYKEKHPDSFMKYSYLKNEIIVHVTVHRVRQWRYIDGKPFLAEAVFSALEADS